MKKEITLATKFTITLLIILFIGQTLGFILFTLSVRSSMIDSLNEKMKRTASLLAGLSINPILEKNDALLNTYLEEIMKDEDIVSVAVFSGEETLLGHKSRTLPHEPSIINPFHVEPFFKSKTPVTLKSEKIGYIITTSSTMKINDEISKYIIFGTIYCGVLLIVVIFLVSEFFSKNIRKPISDFSVAASKAAAGDFTVTVQPEKNLEMKILTEGFNSLTSRLKNTFQKLYLTVNTIMVTVKEMNSFMDRVIKRTVKQTDATENVISAMEKAEDSQKKILNNTHDLAAFSQDNSSSFGQMDATTKEISEMTKELSQYSSEVYSTSANILAEAKTITKEAKEFLKSTEEISSSIEEVSASIKEIESNTKESANLTLLVREIAADTGMLTVADAMGGMDEIMESVDKTIGLVNDLKTRSKDVEKVLTVMADVTRQTNLLSINAAILAAQAGEQGSGFAVVADEIKTLADRTSSSAKEITEIINAIQKRIAELSDVANNNKVIVEKGTALIVRTGEGFAEVINSAQKSSAMAKSIQRLIEEQAKEILRINEAMDVLAKIAAHVTDVVHDQENKSVELLDTAGKFKDISELIDITTKEQNTESNMMTRNLEFANEMIKNIDHATSEQGKTSEEILAVAIKAKEICNETLAIAREMAESFNTLYAEAETLKREIERLKIE